MTLAAFLFSTAAISFSGVMAPGPITALTLGEGNRSPWAGSYVALGHGIVEIPLMAAVAGGLGFFINSSFFKPLIFILGGIIMIHMALGMLRDARIEKAEEPLREGRPLRGGILLSLSNPYFLVWWATVGASMLIKAESFGIKGIVLFGGIHWLCDLVWLTALSWISSRGKHFFGGRFQQVLLGFCGIFLFAFGLFFVVSGAGKFI